MEEAIAWSYDLLTETHQQCFRALGVFVGGWTLAAAEAVCQAEEEKVPGAMILTLAALVNTSLVQVNIPVDGPAHFGTFELIREFALQRLSPLCLWLNCFSLCRVIRIGSKQSDATEPANWSETRGCLVANTNRQLKMGTYALLLASS